MIRNPDDTITNGYDIHVVFTEEQRSKAQSLYQRFIDFIRNREIPHKHHKIFSIERIVFFK